MNLTQLRGRAKQLITKNGFVHSVSVLASGTAVGQVVTIAASPILTRLYTPEDFGLLAVYTSILGILGVIASLRYQLAIPLPESNEDALNVAVLSFFVLTVLAAVFFIVVWAIGSDAVNLLNMPDVEPYLWFMPLGFVLIGCYEILRFWHLRAKSFDLIAKATMVQSASVASVQIAGAALGPLALLGGRIMGQAIVDMILLRRVRGSRVRTKQEVTLKKMLFAAKKYRQFPIFSSWAGLMNASGTQVPPLLFAALYGPAAAGGYMLAQRIINMPLSVIGTAVSDVFFAGSIDAYREKRLGANITKLCSALAGFIFPGAILLFFIGPELFQIIFGENWRVAGEIIRWLSPMLAIQFLVNPVSRVFVTVERQSLALLFQCCLFGLRVGSLFLSYWLDFSLMDAVKTFSVASVIGYLMYLMAVCNIVGLSFEEMFYSLGVFVFSSVVLVIAGGVVIIMSDGLFSLLLFFGLWVVAIAFNFIKASNKDLLA
ncbi:lipopolysaccharide biosynthesis protein [Halomonas urmiana]|uniref:Lipopolysaccharide biosynthesis protein n=1 Tax=Halomonas urmiana TaxID=490901 RepID=A0A5R8M7K3_9GAMM|nr:oligosaccharide flippase family protein [Halomonas urmiana]TLF45506.1 lipopolysaccharide biosynthesis protein [Halomonas urmiana]